MMVKKYTTLLVSLLLFATAASAKAKLPKEQMYSMYNQANQNFRQANSTADTEQAAKRYEKAILGFERIIEEGQVKNSRLYYNLANAYFLHDQLGKAILNYRRAEKLYSADENIKKNLAFARSKRIDKIAVKTEKRVLQTLFFWHYDFSIKTKFLLMCVFFGIVCTCIAGMIWFGRAGSLMVVMIICSILTICFLTSVIVESKNQSSSICGVITAKEVIARQGDGQNYPPSFKEPLHEGTEFDLLENRPGWFHIKLSDDSDGWIPGGSADLI
ncbi:MAG: tetratricopeptide repeat protein [Sedimentisphaerales bacterium]